MNRMAKPSIADEINLGDTQFANRTIYPKQYFEFAVAHVRCSRPVGSTKATGASSGGCAVMRSSVSRSWRRCRGAKRSMNVTTWALAA
jgi:hypothetical protein